MQLYWCSVFILPEGIINEIEKLLRGFLWCQGDLKGVKRKSNGMTYVFQKMRVVLLRQRHPALLNIDTPSLNNNVDKLCWKDVDNLHSCSVARVWESIRPHDEKVPWFNVVWYSHCIPKHTFILWLVMGERLKTQDKLKPWYLRAHPILKCRNSSKVVVAKLCFAASVYCIWQERNSRIFNGSCKTVDQLFEIIRSNVRLKLMSISFNPASQVDQLRVDWHI
ncbi:uncharacterized protein [Rutidosis leptorrhynchoides]|uniref:uncharacterized protein n=1 Tax=Rutidosis leptorrhynchoides TaxID=125765 RepID=UPI003A99B3CB